MTGEVDNKHTQFVLRLLKQVEYSFEAIQMVPKAACRCSSHLGFTPFGHAGNGRFLNQVIFLPLVLRLKTDPESVLDEIVAIVFAMWQRTRSLLRF